MLVLTRRQHLTISVAGSSRVRTLSASVIDSGTTVIEVGHKRGQYVSYLHLSKSSISEFLSNRLGEYFNNSGWRPLTNCCVANGTILLR